MIGSTVSHYLIKEKLGEGSMGVVYKACDTRLEPMLALKFLTAGSALNATARERFIQEAKAAGRLKHPGYAFIRETREFQQLLAGVSR